MSMKVYHMRGARHGPDVVRPGTDRCGRARGCVFEL